MDAATTVKGSSSAGARSLVEARDEVERELCVRKRCFPRWVEDGKISRTDARDRIERLERALQALNRAVDLECATEEMGVPLVAAADTGRPF